MSFWGASDAQKEATGAPREIGAYSRDQMKSWLGRANLQGQRGEQYQGEAADYWRNMRDQGFYSPEDIRGFGQQVMPGVDEAIARRQGRLQDIGADWGTTEAAGRGRLDEKGENINRAYEQGAGTLNDTYGRIGARGEDISNRIVGNIGDTYSAQRGATTDLFGNLINANDQGFGKVQREASGLYGGLRSDAAGQYGRMGGDVTGTYGGLTGDTRGTYGQLQGENRSSISGLKGDTAGTYGNLLTDTGATYSNLQGRNEGAYGKANETFSRMDPLGEYRAGEVARSYAPQMAATNQRLRAAGVDPNSPEGMEAKRRVESAAARSMDDAYATQTEKYVAGKNALTLGQEDINRGLAINRLGTTERQQLGRLGDERSLEMAGQETNRGLALGRLGDERTLATNRLNTSLGLDREQGAIDRQLATEAGGIQRKADIDALMNQQGLATRAGDINRGLALEEGGQFRNELTRNQGLSDQYDTARMRDIYGNDMSRFRDTQGLVDQRGQFDENAWNTRSNLGRELNQEENTALGMKQEQYGQGMNWANAQRSAQNLGATNTGQVGQQALSNASNFGTQANNWAGRAQDAYGQTYQYEAPNAGWGTKLLVGAGAAAADAFVPGSGQVIRGAYSGATGQQAPAFNSPWQRNRAPTRSGSATGPNYGGNVQYDA